MRFVVAVDGSAVADRAVDHAAALAAGVNGSLTVVHAVDPRVYEDGGSEPIATAADADERLVIESVEAAEDRGVRVLEAAAERAADRAVDVETELLYGDPVDAIAEYASEGAYDGVVVGHRGLSGRAEELLGSVAEGLLARADVPVTVVG